MHIGLLSRIHAARFPGKIAIRDPVNSVTYAELESRTNRLAQGMIAHGLRKGDLVGIAVGNRVEHLEAIFGVAKAGAVSLPLDPAWTELEFARAGKFFGYSVMLAEEGVLPKLTGNSTVIAIGGREHPRSIPNEELIEQGEDTDPAISVCEQDPFMIMLTSGTTGTPKGCVVSHGSYLYRSLAYSIEFPMGAEERELVALPVYLGAGRGTTFASLVPGGTVILEPKFDAGRFLDLIEAERITSFSLVPTAFQALAEAADARRDGGSPFDGSSISSMKNVGAALPAEVRKRVRGLISPNLYQTYASVDTGIIAVLRPQEMDEDPAYAGRPIWGMEVSILDDAGQNVSADNLGEVAVRGPLVSDGYFCNPDADAAVFQNDWFRTGDLGSLDREGQLYIRGRKKNVIKSGGRSVFPDEIEAELRSHPAVREAAVFGVPDSKWGEVVCAAVVPEAGDSIAVDALQAYCTDRLARFKCPKRIYVLEDLPRGNLGKVSIDQLIKRFSK
jgi:acyl-CoA synthetase (AMP-forming)/AMP-acid ligase II